MSPVASPMAKQAVSLAVEKLRHQGVVSSTPPQLFAAANDAAWDAGLMLSGSDVWMAVYDWGGYDYDNPPPDETAMKL